MHDVHLSRLDLNLLVALQALLAERHVTRAAARVGLTQPAMSHALARLRGVLDDPLLVRTRDGLVLTPRAEELRPPLDRVLAEVQTLFAPAARFEPATARRTFRVVSSDYVELALMPAVLARVWKEAPGIDVHLTSSPAALESLEDDRVDLAIVPPVGETRSGFYVQRILSERFVCVVRTDHPSVKRRLGLAQFLALPHALVAPRGEAGGIVDDALAKLGEARRVAVRVPHFLVAPFLVERSDLVLTLAERVARSLAPSVKLRVVAPPKELDLPGFTIALYWHARHHADPAQAWFRALVADVARTV